MTTSNMFNLHFIDVCLLYYKDNFSFPEIEKEDFEKKITPQGVRRDLKQKIIFI